MCFEYGYVTRTDCIRTIIVGVPVSQGVTLAVPVSQGVTLPVPVSDTCSSLAVHQNVTVAVCSIETVECTSKHLLLVQHICVCIERTVSLTLLLQCLFTDFRFNSVLSVMLM